MPKTLIKYSYFFLVLPVILMLYAIKINLESAFAFEAVLYGYLILYFFSALINNKSIRFIYISFVYLISILLSYFEWCYVTLYHERINVSTVYILLQTNSFESFEYVQQYLSFKMIVVFILLVFASVFILRGTKVLVKNYTTNDILSAIKNDIINLFKRPFVLKIKSFLNWITSTKHRKKVFIFALSLLFILGYLNANHHKQQLLYQAYNGYLQYKEEQKKYNDFVFNNSKNRNPLNAKSNNNANFQETYLLVLGESTTKTHLQLYNYYRKTNPLLSKLKNETVVFSDVISPHTHTSSSLEKVLTLSNYENPKKSHDGTIIELMKQAGFKTYWISNQIPVGINETLVTSIAKQSDELYFTNSGDENEQQSLDEKVFPYLDKVLKENTTKKFIIIHLLGTHIQYHKRYPKSFDIFKNAPPAFYDSEETHRVINNYDNAILYNDYVVSNLIDRLKISTQNQKASLIYLSDHGEEVFETINMVGHSESIASKPMYMIPFIFWSNNKKEIEIIQQFKNRKYLSDDLIFSIADLANVDFKGNELERSIFNINFKERKRIVKNDKDFDILFP